MAAKKATKKVTAKKPVTKKRPAKKDKPVTDVATSPVVGASSGGELAPGQFHSGTIKHSAEEIEAPFFRSVVNEVSRLLDSKPGTAVILIIGDDRNDDVLSAFLGNQCGANTAINVCTRSISFGSTSLENLSENI
jgi:hypothetical protein